MRLTCSFCGKAVSTELPDHVITDCWIECASCIEKEYHEIPESKRLIVKKYKECQDDQKG